MNRILCAVNRHRGGGSGLKNRSAVVYGGKWGGGVFSVNS